MIAGDHFSRLDATSLIQSEYFRAAHGTLKPLRSCTELKAYKGTAFEQPLRTAFQKLQAAGQWYLLGYDRNRKARRIFVLARMQKVSRTNQRLSNPRPGEGERPRSSSRTELAFQSADPGVSQR
jgi:WYL domain